MNIWEYLYKRKRDRLETARELLLANQSLNQKRIDLVREMSKDVCSFTHKFNLPYEFIGISADNEPFGWPRGTVRGIITIWTVLTLCIITMWSIMTGANIIPIEWFLGIMGMIIMSYFYTRFKMSSN